MDLVYYGKLFEPDPKYYSETYLQKLWKNELWKDCYRAEGGEEIRVLDPGDHNPVQGPDFKNARVFINSVMRNGDVELHFDNLDWYQHGHQYNPDYNSVILHVVFRNRDAGTFVRNERRQKIPVVCVPFKDLPGDGGHDACRPSQKGPETLVSVLMDLGRKRILEKAAYFYARRRRFSFDLLFLWGLFKVCGYRYNSSNFINLFLDFPWEEYRTGSMDTIQTEALLFGLSGIKPVSVDDRVLDMRDILKPRLPLKRSGPPLIWSYTKSRPVNFPDRRIAWLSAFLVKHRGRSFREIVLEGIALNENPEKTLENLLDAGPYRPYWSVRYRLGGPEGPVKDLTPGKTFRREFMLNILYPLIKAEEMMPGADTALKNAEQRLQKAAEGIKLNSLYLDAESFLDRHGVISHPSARSWMLSQGVLYCREHYCALKLREICPVCSDLS